MARGINKVILVGNLGQDPETRAMPSGKAVTNVQIATTDSWRDKQSGEQKEIVANEMQMLGGRSGAASASQAPSRREAGAGDEFAQAPAGTGGKDEAFDDDIPF